MSIYAIKHSIGVIYVRPQEARKPTLLKYIFTIVLTIEYHSFTYFSTIGVIFIESGESLMIHFCVINKLIKLLQGMQVVIVIAAQCKDDLKLKRRLKLKLA